MNRLVARLRKHAMQIIGGALTIGVFVFVLPRVADYGAVLGRRHGPLDT